MGHCVTKDVPSAQAASSHIDIPWKWMEMPEDVRGNVAGILF